MRGTTHASRRRWHRLPTVEVTVEDASGHIRTRTFLGLTWQQALRRANAWALLRRR